MVSVAISVNILIIYYLGLNQQQLEAKNRKSVNQQNHHPSNTEDVENIPLTHTHTSDKTLKHANSHCTLLDFNLNLNVNYFLHPPQ